MNALLKTSIATFSATTIAATGYLSTLTFKKSNTKLNSERVEKLRTPKKVIDISKIISDKYDYILLNTDGDDIAWKAKWANYQRKNSEKAKGEDDLVLPSWKEGNKEDLTTELKEKCKSLLIYNDGFSEDDLYSKTTKYCARGVTFEEQANKENLTILDTENNGNDADIWNSRNTKRAYYVDEFSKLNIKDVSELSKIKEGCKVTKANNKQIENYEEVFKAYKKLCTKQENEA